MIRVRPGVINRFLTISFLLFVTVVYDWAMVVLSLPDLNNPSFFAISPEVRIYLFLWHQS